MSVVSTLSLRWIAAAGGALAASAAAAWLIGFAAMPAMPIAPPARGGAVKPTVGMSGLLVPNAAVQEAAEMRDLAPLFLPTERNAQLSRLPRREPGQTMLDVDAPRWAFQESALRFSEALPSPAALNGRPAAEAGLADALVPTAGAVALTAFGRGEAPLPRLSARGATVHVVATATGEEILQAELPADAAPPSEKVWQPVQFLAGADAAGLVGPLIVVEGSRVEEVDQYFRRYLVESFRIGQRLSPGSYRITVGP